MDTFSATRLRGAIEAKGITQEALAREVDVSLRTVQLWLSGSEPKGRQLVRMASALGREPGWFYEPEEAAA